MSKFFVFIFISTLFSCSIYTSTGRKDFESKSPDYVKTQSFIGCEPVLKSDFDAGFLDSFLSRSTYRDENFWVAEMGGENIYQVAVLDHRQAEVCNYRFADTEQWLEEKPHFLKHLP